MTEQEFTLGDPVLVCRWRMASKHVPLLNRHMRALSQRRIHGEPISANMLSWAKQHIEWSLAEGDYPQADGVLMLVIDEAGHAAMSVGDYVPLPDTALAALARRALEARREASETGVAPEALCAVRCDPASGRETLLVALGPDEHPCGTLTLVEQLAQARGLAVERPAVTSDASELLASLATEEVFLVSDEHGVVPAPAATDPFIALASDGLRKLHLREQASKGR